MKAAQGSANEAIVAPIAIVGIGCRYAGARGAEAFWSLALEGRFTVRDAPAHRQALGYRLDHYLDERPRIPGRIASAKAGFIDHPERFDPTPFGLSPRDAAAMEPQARMMFEVVWDAIEDAGVPVEDVRGERVSVYVGHTAEDFSRERIALMGEDAAMRALDVRTAVGYSRAAFSVRLSLWLDLRGPSLTLAAACSSSLYAVHLACQSLWNGESTMALAGGVNLFLTPEGSLALARSGMMALDGRCKAFDARADGFVRAEGAGCVLLRPLSEALAAGDRVHAVIRGSGASADGRDGGHMMAPGRTGQVQAMRDAYRSSGVDPSEIDFVQAHGTGTVVGDPIEMAALGDVMGAGRAADRPLRVSSVKGNIGHAESASGIAGLIITALAVRERAIPAQLHFETPSDRIDWAAFPVEVPRESLPWPHEGRALAAVNSFGISGTNAHVIVEAAPSSAESKAALRPRFFALSAHDEDSLRELAGAHADRLRQEPHDDAALSDLAFTLARRRTHLPQRIAVVADSSQALAAELESYASGRPSAALHRSRANGKRPVVFVFPGQGAQWLGMARDLLRTAPAFAASIEASDSIHLRVADWSIHRALRSPDEGRAALARLSRLQPLLVAVQVALSDWLAAHGIVPDAVLGQSVGELAAAYAAGALDREDVVRLAHHRGRAVERVAGRGAMALVGLPASEVEARLPERGGVELAGTNGPDSVLVAGDPGAVRAFVDSCEAEGRFARLLDVDFASHCALMDPVLDDFEADISGIRARASEVVFYSTTDGAPREPGTLDVRYWRRNLRNPVRLLEAGRQLLTEGPASAGTCIELSPHPSLTRALVEIAADGGAQVDALHSLRRDGEGRIDLAHLLAALHVRGHLLDLSESCPSGRVVSLPLMPFRTQTLWFGERRRRPPRAPAHPLIGPSRVDALQPGRTSFEVELDADVSPIFGLARPAEGARLSSVLALEVAMAAGRWRWPDGRVEVTGLEIERLAPADPAARMPGLVLQASIVEGSEGILRFELHGRWASSAEARWQRLALATLSRPTGVDASAAEPIESLDALRGRCADTMGETELQALLEAQEALPIAGLRAIGGAWISRARGGWPRPAVDELLLELELPSRCQNDAGHLWLHPALVDSALSCTSALLNPGMWDPELSALGRASVPDARLDHLLVHARLEESHALALTFYDVAGRVMGRLSGVQLALRDGAGAEGQGGLRRAGVAAIRPAMPTQSGYAARWSASASRTPAEWRRRAAEHVAFGEIRVKVSGVALGRSDGLVALGLTPAPCDGGPGCEYAGRVIEVGEGVEDLHVGDPVIGMAHHALADEVVCDARCAARLHHPVELARAAASPLALALAHRALVESARLREGDRVLVMAGGGGVGAGLVALAAALGAEVVAVATGARRLALLRRHGAAHTLDATSDFVGALRQIAGGQGFDVAVVAGDDARRSVVPALLSGAGHFVDLGAERSASRPMANQSLHAIDFTRWWKEEPGAVGIALRAGLAQAGPLLAERTECFAPRHLSRALAAITQGANAGRVVVDFERDPEVLVEGERRRPDSGAPGRALRGDLIHFVSAEDCADLEGAATLVGHLGARALLVHARSAASEQGLTELRDRLAGRGLRVVVAKGAWWEVRAEIEALGTSLGSATLVPGALPGPGERDPAIRRIRSLAESLRVQPMAPMLILMQSADGRRARRLRAAAVALCGRRRASGGRAVCVSVDPADGCWGPARAEALARAVATAERDGRDARLIAGTRRGGPAAWANDEAAGRPGGSADSLWQLEESERGDALRIHLRSLVAGVLALGHEAAAALDDDASLVDQGLDSLVGMELALEIERSVGVAVPLSVWAERPGIASLVQVLLEAGTAAGLSA